jgi:transcriptional regulator with XRE-family HTH domain
MLSFKTQEAVMTLGEKIKRLRTEKGISQEELGREMGGVHYTHISRYERNQSTPSIEALKKLAKIFGVSADYLLFDDIDKMTLGDIHDPELLNQFRELDRLDNEVRGKARFLLEAILTQQQVQQIASKTGARH